MMQLIKGVLGLGFILFLFFLGFAHGETIIGDSIAAGTGNAMGIRTHALQNMGSCWIRDHYTPINDDVVIISAGINDGGGCVASLRTRVHARRVLWILPAPINPGYAAVSTVAYVHRDLTVGYRCAGGCTKSNFHPANYGTVAWAIQAKLGLRHRRHAHRSRHVRSAKHRVNFVR